MFRRIRCCYRQCLAVANSPLRADLVRLSPSKTSSTGNASYLYSAGDRFESRLGRRLSWPRFIGVFFLLPRHATSVSFQVFPSALLTDFPTLRTTDSVCKKIRKKCLFVSVLWELGIFSRDYMKCSVLYEGNRVAIDSLCVLPLNGGFERRRRRTFL
jgi:hypothetical protein